MYILIQYTSVVVKETFEIITKMNAKRTRRQHSRLADVSYRTVQGVWRDPYREISIKTLEKFAKALGVSSHELIEDVPDETST